MSHGVRSQQEKPKNAGDDVPSAFAGVGERNDFFAASSHGAVAHRDGGRTLGRQSSTRHDPNGFRLWLQRIELNAGGLVLERVENRRVGLFWLGWILIRSRRCWCGLRGWALVQSHN